MPPPSPPPLPPPPPPAIICETTPAHDVTSREDDTILCPQAGCGGRLIEIECARDPAHELSGRRPDRLDCPICGSALQTPVCTRDATHSIAQRPTEDTVCPICGSSLRREKVIVKGIRRPNWMELIRQYLSRVHISSAYRRQPNWMELIRAYRWPLAGAAVLACAALAIVWWPLIPVPTCGGLPKTRAEAIVAVSVMIKSHSSGEDAKATAQSYLTCGRVVPALLLLRYASDEGDGEAARILGRLYDPSAPNTVAARQPGNAQRAIHWYTLAATAHDKAVAADLRRLGAWLADKVKDGDSDTARQAQEAQSVAAKDL